MTTSFLVSMLAIALNGAGAGYVIRSSPATPVPPQHQVQPKVAHLVNTPTTPEGHRDLAQYFRREANRKRQEEQHYAETAAIYRLHPPRVDAVRNVSTADYYQHLAEQAQSAALDYDQLAMDQEVLAQSLVPAK